VRDRLQALWGYRVSAVLAFPVLVVVDAPERIVDLIDEPLAGGQLRPGEVLLARLKTRRDDGTVDVAEMHGVSRAEFLEPAAGLILA
jgi:hypothetical protein